MIRVAKTKASLMLSAVGKIVEPPEKKQTSIFSILKTPSSIFYNLRSRYESINFKDTESQERWLIFKINKFGKYAGKSYDSQTNV